jgi:hypothetical protein
LALKSVRIKLVESGMARSSVNASVGRIRRLFRFAVANETVPVECLTRLEAVSPLLVGRTEARDLPPPDASRRREQNLASGRTVTPTTKPATTNRRLV